MDVGERGRGERADLSWGVLAGLGGEQWAEEVGGICALFFPTFLIFLICG